MWQEPAHPGEELSSIFSLLQTPVTERAPDTLGGLVATRLTCWGCQSSTGPSSAAQQGWALLWWQQDLAMGRDQCLVFVPLSLPGQHRDGLSLTRQPPRQGWWPLWVPAVPAGWPLLEVMQMPIARRWPGLRRAHVTPPVTQGPGLWARIGSRERRKWLLFPAACRGKYPLTSTQAGQSVCPNKASPTAARKSLLFSPLKQLIPVCASVMGDAHTICFGVF